MEHDSSSIRFQFNEKPAAVQQVTGAQKKPDSEADRSTSKNEDVLFDTPTHYPGSPVLGVGEQFDELDAHRLYALDNGDKATFLEPISPRERSSSIEYVKSPLHCSSEYLFSNSLTLSLVSSSSTD